MTRPFARPEDVRRPFEPGDLEPGLFPFTRGVQPTMYRDRLWTMRQYAGYGSAAESNGRFRFLLAQGVTGLSVAFDLPTQMGFDPDHPLAAGEVGRVGVSIASLDDMAALFEAVPLDGVSVSMTINATAAILLACYVALARRRNVPPARLAGTIQNDVLKEYIARGTYIYPPRRALQLVTDVMAWCDRELPQWHPISISGYHMREAGATAAQEVAFTLANGVTYVEAARDAGLDLDRIGARLSFFFAAHNDFLEEIAKFRAARRLWAHLMRDRFGVSNDRACQLRFHTQTAGSTLTAQQPDNNVVRVALQALAAVLGGTQSLHCNSRDEALGLPSEAAATLALRTQQIIAHETGVAAAADPLGGAWEIERRTEAIETQARALIAEIDASGGTVAAVERGHVQRSIQEAAYRDQQTVDSAARVVVGVNRFQEERPVIQPFRVDPEVERRQIAAVRALRAQRGAAAWQSALDALASAARDGVNVMPFILGAVEAHATVGEIADVLRGVFGEYRDPHA
ncbi:MAG: methylmalonyl-CoA mutase [Acidobacteria bacterium]|nr:methylmalonyl-CoA mutase [Acidobacteriota bacterium]